MRLGRQVAGPAALAGRTARTAPGVAPAVRLLPPAWLPARWRSALAAASFLALLLAAPRPATAQAAKVPLEVRHGLWIDFGLGGGQVDYWSDQQPTASRTTVTMALRGGIVVAPALRLGIEVNGWGIEMADMWDPAQGVSVNETLLIAQLYPWPARNLYLKGGLGWGAFNTNHADDFGSSAFGAVIAGVGYDIRLGRSISVTVAADYARGPMGSADARITTSTGRRFRAWSVNLGLQYH